MKLKFLLYLGAILSVFLGTNDAAYAESKVYLIDGQTRLGFVNVRFGRVTVKAVDRLFQHPEEAIHRIEHVTGETTLIGRDGILLREEPEKLSKTLIAIPKGCEVHVEEVEGDWIKVRVYAGRDESVGYLHTEDLSDEVFFHHVSPQILFKAPPTNLKDIGDPEAIRQNLIRMGRLNPETSETSFSASPDEGNGLPVEAPTPDEEPAPPAANE